jgi:hypothetical protein
LERNDESAFERVAFSPDARWMAAVTDRHDLRIWDITRGHEVGSAPIDLKAHPHCRCLVFSPDRKHLAATFERSLIGEPRFFVCLWDLSLNGQPTNFRTLLSQIEEQAATPLVVHHVSFSPDGRTVTAGSPNRSVHLWEVATGQERLHFTGGVVSAFSPDGRTLVTVDFDGTTERRDPSSGAPLDSDDRKRTDFHYVEQAVFSADAQKVAISDRFTLKIRDVVKDRTVGRLQLPRWCVPLSFSPDGRSLVVSTGRHVGLLDGTTGQPCSWSRVEGWSLVAFCNSGKELTGVDGDAVVRLSLADVLAGGDKIPEPSHKKVQSVILESELAAELVADKNTYDLDLGRKSAEEFSKLILGATKPPTPIVNLTLKVKNTGKKEIKFSTQSEHIELHLVGDGAINLPSGFGQWIVLPDTKPPCSLAAGETRSIHLTSLQYEESGNRSLNRAYWLVPGDYTIFVTYNAFAFLPAEREKKGARESGSVAVRCPPIKLTVRESKK